MQKTMPRTAVAVAVVLALAVAGPTAALDPIDEGALPLLSEGEQHRAHDQHGGLDGHLEPSSTDNIELVGKMRINQDLEGRVADVGVLGDTAYLAAWSAPDCQKGGVYVFDISNPAKPKQINFIRTLNDSYAGEGVQAVHLSTSQWTGDLLAFNNEDCTNKSRDPKFVIGKTSKHSVGGASFIDVTNPKVHRYLAEGIGDRTQGVLGTATEADAHEIHSVFVWEDENDTAGNDADDTAYAVLVDNEESADVDILDITNPASPVLIAEFDLNATFPQIIQPELGSIESFLHDMVVKKIGPDYVMLLSYWDGGYVTLNVNDPTAPVYIGDTDFPVPDELLNDRVDPDPDLPSEGNGHEAEFSLNNQYIVAADEDFDAFKPFLSIDGGAAAAFSAGTATGPQLGAGDTLAGGTRFAGTGCDAATFPAPAGATIAVIERGACTFQVKLDNASAAGYDAAIVVNSTGGNPPCENLVGMLATTDILSFFVSRSVGYAILGVGGYNPANCPGGANPALPASGTAGLPIEISVEFDGWGYVRLFENESGKMTELDTYAIPEAHDVDFASGFGDLSVHEVAMSQTMNNVAYFSYYSAGFRVAEIEGGQLVEKGHFIDATGDGGNNFWGVQVWQHDGQEYVLASDRDFGLYIFKYTPDD